MTHPASIRYILCLFACFIICGCSSSQKITEPHEPPVFEYDRIVKGDIETPLDIWDPLEKANRSSYKFNANFDKYVYLPALSGYQNIIPDPIEKGISNIFYNLDNVRTLINEVLQLKLKKAFETTARLTTNLTLGLLGIFDVATYFEMPRHDEDFGQTLGFYGIGPGPYAVLPILGPSSARDGFGKLLDGLFVTPLFFDGHSDRKLVAYPLRFDVVN